MSPAFQKNALYRRRGVEDEPVRYVRILHVPPGQALLSCIDLPDRAAMPRTVLASEIGAEVEAGELVLQRPDPHLVGARATPDLSRAERAIVEARWRTISGLVEDPDQRVLQEQHRGQLVAAMAAQLGVSKSTIYNNLRVYWQGGQFRNALVPGLARCGGRGVPRRPGGRKQGRDRSGENPREGVVGADFKAIMLEAIPLLVAGHSFAQARKVVIRENFGESVEVDGRPVWQPPRECDVPSIAQFRYWCNQAMGRTGLVRARVGRNNWENNYAPKTGTLRASVRGPGELYQMDSTVGDIMLRSSHSRDRLVGRPIIYIVVDVYTGLIVGFHVCLKPPSVREMRLALENAMTDKVEFCRRLGVAIEEEQWPARHRPGNLLTDGGPEFVSAFLDAVGVDLDFHVSTAPPYQAAWKGLVEGKFNLLNVEFASWAPGTHRKRERGDKPCKLDCVYDLAGFRKALTIWILEHNGKRVANWPRGWTSPDGADPTMLELWSWGCRHNAAPATVEAELVRQTLLERSTGKLSQRGLRFNGRLYVPVAGSESDALSRIPGARFGSRRIRHDARDIGSIVVASADERTTSEWVLHDDYQVFAGWSEDEYEDHTAWRSIGSRRREMADIARDARWVTEQEQLAREMGAQMQGIRAVPGPDGIKANRRREVVDTAAATRNAALATQAALPAPAPPDAVAVAVAQPQARRRSFAPSVVD